MTITLRPQQQAALNWLHGRTYGALFGDLGTGKTLVLLSLIQTLKNEGFGQVLLVAPKNVRNYVWQQESEKFGCFDLSFSKSFGPADVHLVNPERLKDVPDWLAYDSLIVDESTDFKNHSTIRFKNFSERVHLFRRRFILSAGPIPNGYHDLWAQMFIVDLGVRLGKNITAFRRAYCQRSHSGYTYDVLPQCEPIIDDLISDTCFRMDRSDLDIPDKHDIDIMIDLGDSLMKTYRSLDKKLFAEIQGKRVLAMSASAAYTKCKQFAGGFVYLGEKPDVMHVEVHREKLHALGRVHAEIGYKPILVLYQYTAEGRAIEKRFGCPRIHGGTTEKRVGEILDAWNRGELPMLAAQIHTIAMGLNMQFGGSHIAVYSIPDNYNDYFQVVGRLWRPGVKNDVWVYHIKCRNTVDELKLEPRLKKKESTQKRLLRAIRGYQRSMGVTRNRQTPPPR